MNSDIFVRLGVMMHRIARPLMRPVSGLYCAEGAVDPFGLRKWEVRGHVPTYWEGGLPIGRRNLWELLK
jgi:hypothetical protein